MKAITYFVVYQITDKRAHETWIENAIICNTHPVRWIASEAVKYDAAYKYVMLWWEQIHESVADDENVQKLIPITEGGSE